ncbi:MAG: tRNA 4-thiouridine(8) synthase ThiI [Proteobacteria bacterium]|nr:tRNA 4-thiouridine(8) synthase ThiI [Pseudomonadota bacterium]
MNLPPQGEVANPSDALIVLRHGEIFLKGDNRHHFEQLLVRNARRALAVLPNVTLERAQGRCFARVPQASATRAISALQRVFGFSSLSPAIPCAPELEALTGVAVEAIGRLLQQRPIRSFKVATRRSDKRFPLPSTAISAHIGAAVIGAFGLPVDVHAPDVTVGVEIGREQSFVFVERLPCGGGLPVGSTGEVLLLLSGGIDSPVAGHLLQKRGCALQAIYFHSPPHTGPRAEDKVQRLARRLALCQQQPVTLHLVHFTAIQERIHAEANAELLVVLYRRAMMRIASSVAKRCGCRALVTGDNLGQVASQTLENLCCVEDAAALPVLRPLLSFDKHETVALAQQLGSFEISIEPHVDCCSLFVPRHPATRVSLKRAAAAEASLALAPLIEQAAAEAQTYRALPAG